MRHRDQGDGTDEGVSEAATSSKAGAKSGWEPGATLNGHRAPVCAVAWASERDWVATASRDETVRIWRPVEGAAPFELLATLGHAAAVAAVGWSPAGAGGGPLLLTGSQDGKAIIWHTAGGAAGSAWQKLATLGNHAEAVTAVSWSPDGNRAAYGVADASTYIWQRARSSPKTWEQLHLRLTGVASTRRPASHHGPRAGAR